VHVHAPLLMGSHEHINHTNSITVPSVHDLLCTETQHSGVSHEVDVNYSGNTLPVKVPHYPGAAWVAGSEPGKTVVRLSPIIKQ